MEKHLMIRRRKTTTMQNDCKYTLDQLDLTFTGFHSRNKVKIECKNVRSWSTGKFGGIKHTTPKLNFTIDHMNLKVKPISNQKLLIVNND